MPPTLNRSPFATPWTVDSDVGGLMAGLRRGWSAEDWSFRRSMVRCLVVAEAMRCCLVLGSKPAMPFRRANARFLRARPSFRQRKNHRSGLSSQTMGWWSEVPIRYLPKGSGTAGAGLFRLSHSVVHQKSPEPASRCPNLEAPDQGLWNPFPVVLRSQDESSPPTATLAGSWWIEPPPKL